MIFLNKKVRNTHKQKHWFLLLSFWYILWLMLFLLKLSAEYIVLVCFYQLQNSHCITLYSQGLSGSKVFEGV